MVHERLYSVGTKIKQIREGKGMSCYELAKRAGVSKQYVYKIERDITRNISYSVIKKFADSLDVNPAFLVGWSNSMERTPDIINGETSDIINEAVESSIL